MTTYQPIVLTTRTLGSSTGVSQAALDLLLALSRAGSSLTVRAWVPRRLPSSVDGLAVGPCQLEVVSPLTAARAVLLGEAPPRSAYEHLRRALAQPWLARAPQAALEVVNGLGAQRLHEAVSARVGRARVSALVVHESPRHFEQPGRMHMAAALRAVRAHDYRVFVSARGQQEWNALAGLDPAHSMTIPNCVREQRVAAVRASDRAALRRRLGYAQDSVHLVCVGSVVQRKGQDILIDALQELGTSGPHVDVLGPVRGVWAERLVARVSHTRLGSRVRFLGEKSDVYERIYAADGLVLASRAEASPLSVLEAMALGRCVVAADVDGLAELIVHDASGLLVASEDPAALASALLRVTEAPQLRAALGSAARERYLSEFQRARQLARWADAVAHMLA